MEVNKIDFLFYLKWILIGILVKKNTKQRKEKIALNIVLTKLPICYNSLENKG